MARAGSTKARCSLAHRAREQATHAWRPQLKGWHVLLYIAILLSHHHLHNSLGIPGIHHDFIVIIQSPSSPSTIVITGPIIIAIAAAYRHNRWSVHASCSLVQPFQGSNLKSSRSPRRYWRLMVAMNTWEWGLFSWNLKPYAVDEIVNLGLILRVLSGSPLVMCTDPNSKPVYRYRYFSISYTGISVCGRYAIGHQMLLNSGTIFRGKNSKKTHSKRKWDCWKKYTQSASPCWFGPLFKKKVKQPGAPTHRVCVEVGKPSMCCFMPVCPVSSAWWFGFCCFLHYKGL